MAAGSWFDWTTGDLVTEAKFQDIQDSILFIYASDAAANSALTNKVEGTVYFNTTDDVLKVWDGSAWLEVGGVDTFDVDFLVIGGGGAGAGNETNNHFYGSGGGGAGGYRTSYGSGSISGGNSEVETAYKVLADGTTTYTVTVGAGSGTNLILGSNSVFDEIISYGGGSNDLVIGSKGNTGASGSGNGSGGSTKIGYGLTGQGSNGGSSTAQAGSGGGGASAVGGNCTNYAAPGAGGNGQSSSITGSAVTRAGGGGGAAGFTGTGASGGTGGGGDGADGANGGNGITGSNGTVNTGGGGGGGSGANGTGVHSSNSNGGSGVVILRWATADATIGATRTGLTDGGVQTDGSDSYIVFTAGTGNITFS